MSQGRRRKLVLVGGGHAHVQVLRDFAASPPPDCDLTVVVDRPIAMYSGMVPGYVAGDYRREDLEIDVRPLAARAGGRTVIAPVQRVDAVARTLALAGHEPVPYDVASFNIGSTVAGTELPGVRDHALPTRPISGLVDRIHQVLDRAADDRPVPRITIVGAGVAGVELALTIDHHLRRVRGSAALITLLEAGPKPLADQAATLRRRALRLLARRAIDVRCGTRVAAVEPDRVLLERGAPLPGDAVVWVTGAVSHPIFRPSGLPTDGRGFLRVRSTLQAEGHDEIFAAGDCATLVEHPGVAKAGVYAVREGPVVAANLRACLAGEPLRRYRPQRGFLVLMNAGGGVALGSKWGVSFQGRWVMRLKDRIDRRFVGLFQATMPRT